MSGYLRKLMARLDWPAVPGYILFFLMLFVPAAYQVVKAPFLILVVLAALIYGLKHGFRLHPTISSLTGLNFTAGLFFIAVGMINGAPGARSVATVYCLWPLVFTLMVSGITEKRLAALTRIMLFASIAITLYAFSFLLSAAGVLPAWLFIPLNMEEGVNIEEGVIEVSLTSTGTLIYLVPFILAILMTWPRNQRTPLPRPLLWTILALGIAYTLVSGRRAAFLTVGLSPVITLAFWEWQAPELRRLSRKSLIRVFGGLTLLAVVTLLILQIRFGFDFSKILDSIANGFEFGATEDSAVRKEQFLALWNEWLESPLIGQGHGAVARGSLRSILQPWSYELSYSALLFHTGIVGVAVYSAGVLWIYRTGLFLLREGNRVDPLLLPALVGMTSFLLANASNPYLEKYDFMWVLFFPIAILNLTLLRRRSERMSNAAKAGITIV